MNTIKLPFGIKDIKKSKDTLNSCPIIECKTSIKYPSKNVLDSKLNFCERHGIYVRKSTFIYKSMTDNLIIDREIFKDRIIEGGDKKFDVNKIGNEKSEDALTWNVFRTLQKTNLLKNFIEFFIGERIEREPQLYLWGVSCSDDSFEVWPRLEEFRKKYENHVKPPTEPDIILFTGKLMVSIEAKFTSGNKKDNVMVFGEYLKRYYGENISEILNSEYIKQQTDFYSQLVRNVIFGYYAAEGKRFYLLNLLSVNPKINKEIKTEDNFKYYVKHPYIFKKIYWEHIYNWLKKINDRNEVLNLKEYIKNKTANFQKAFDIRE